MPNNVTKSFGTSNEVYKRYNAVSATLDTKGIKEYWVSCDSHQSVFTKPEGATIEEGGTPTQQFIDKLDANDARLVNKTSEVLSFENDNDANYITKGGRNGLNVKEITSEYGATDGSKALKLAITSGTDTLSAVLSEEILDRMFADPNVVEMRFDAKAGVDNGVFLMNINGTPKYEQNDTVGYGLTTEWKTFAFSRAKYNDFKALSNKNVGYLFWVGKQSAKTYVIVDNFRPATSTLDVYGLECGRLVDAVTYPNKVSVRNIAGAESFVVISGNDTMEYGYDYDLKTEGNRSIKRHKTYNKYLQVASPALYKAISDTDVVSIDVYSSATYNANPANKGIHTGAGNPLGTETDYQHKGGKWCTYNFTKADFNSWGMFLEVSASTESDFWFDNLRVTSAETYAKENSFEANLLSDLSSTNVVYMYGGKKDIKPVADGFEQAIDQVLRITGDAGALTNVHLTKTIKSEGNQALMFTRAKSNETALYFSTAMKNQLKEGGSVSFDLYSTIAANPSAKTMIDGNRANAVFNGKFHPAYKWTTYTFTAENLSDDGRFLIISGSTLGDWVIDNIVYKA